MMDIIRAFHDKNLLGAGIRDFSTFAAWEVALRAIFGLGFVDDNQRPIYQRCTHRTVMMALSAVWLAGSPSSVLATRSPISNAARFST